MMKKGIKVGVSPPSLPTTFEACSGQLGIIPKALYLFNEYSGSLTDVTNNGNTLLATSSPMYNQSVGGHCGVMYPSGSHSSHEADVCDAGLNSIIYSGLFVPNDDTGTNIIVFGRTNKEVCGVLVEMVAGQNYPSLTVADIGLNTVTVNATGIDVRTSKAPVLVSAQIDRGNQLCRIRVSSQGRLQTEQSASIAALGTLTTSPQSFGVGDILGSGPSDCSVCWLMAAEGIQCEGTDVLKRIARKLECE